MEVESVGERIDDTERHSGEGKAASRCGPELGKGLEPVSRVEIEAWCLIEAVDLTERKIHKRHHEMLQTTAVQ